MAPFEAPPPCIPGRCALYGWTVLIGDPTEAKTFSHRRHGMKPVERPFTARSRSTHFAGRRAPARDSRSP